MSFGQPVGRLIAWTDFLRIADERVEYSSVEINEDGTVTIAVSHYRTLMRESGWKEKPNGERR